MLRLKLKNPLLVLKLRKLNCFKLLFFDKFLIVSFLFLLSAITSTLAVFTDTNKYFVTFNRVVLSIKMNSLAILLKP